jgi:hypothetical protein
MLKKNLQNKNRGKSKTFGFYTTTTKKFEMIFTKEMFKELVISISLCWFLGSSAFDHGSVNY